LVGQVSRWWARGEIGDGWHGLGAASGQVAIVWAFVVGGGGGWVWSGGFRARGIWGVVEGHCQECGLSRGDAVDHGSGECLIFGMGMGGWMFLLVPAHPGSPEQKGPLNGCVHVVLHLSIFLFQCVCRFLKSNHLRQFSCCVIYTVSQKKTLNSCP